MIGAYPKPKKFVSRNGFPCPNHASDSFTHWTQPIFTLWIDAALWIDSALWIDAAYVGGMTLETTTKIRARNT